MPTILLRRASSVLLVGLLLFSGCSSGGPFSRANERYGRYENRGARANYPNSARVGGSGANARYRVCHNGRNALTLPASAVDAHLRHGDRFGYCSSNRNDDGRRNRNGRGNGNGNSRSHDDDDDDNRRRGDSDDDD